MLRFLFLAMITLGLSADSALGQPPVIADIPADYEIADVRTIPQHFGGGSFRPDFAPDASCRASFLAEFLDRYYAPWREEAPLSDIPRSLTTMKEHAAREWYGDNRRKVSRKFLDGLLEKCDLDRFPSLSRRAVALVPTSLRVLPTARPFFDKPEDFPFDKLQNAGLKLDEPIRVLHLSRDGVWAFAETADANGWVPVRDISYIDEATANGRMARPLVVIVRDSFAIRHGLGSAALPAGFGTLLPLRREDGDAYEVAVAVDDGNGETREIVARVPKDAARRFPLVLDAANVAMVGNELIDVPYGWGELYGGRDCSNLMRGFFAPFGFWLPRGSYNQITSGRRIFLTGLTSAEKERFIRENGVPFLTLLHMNGHIMLYVGTVNEKPLIFHAFWGVNIKKNGGGSVKHVVGKSVISTLNPGAELPLANGSFLDKIGSMLILGDRCPPAPPQETQPKKTVPELPQESNAE